MRWLGVGFVLILNLAVGFSVLPSTLQVCSISDPNLSQCIINVVDSLRPNIASGNYGDGRVAPSLDPYSIAQMDVDHGPSFNAKLKNVTIEGVRDFVIKKLRPDLSEKRFNITAKLPNLFVRGKYNLNMNILLLKISGDGNFNLTLGDTLVSLKIQYYLDSKDGKDYMKFKPIDVRFKFDKAEFYLQNLFNGDPALEKIGNQAINANPHLLLEEVRPSIEEHMKGSLTQISNIVVQGAEVKELLPP
ncbi:circadian clock-controlled protein daywake-like [Malaya genurostris]|uniref:circadian clock-controlled protein daywake-like n=1 Tax=Malaya genurostris TaxID=325434 RepID=UPI0026F3C074|nr:circadian clock-controlled protein daywake-like [Malaya genurostris]